MQAEKLNPDQSLCSKTKITQDFFNLLKLGNDEVKGEEDEALDDHGDDEEEEEEFSFMCGETSQPVSAEDAFIDGQIKPVFPLFNRDSFFSSDGLHESLPMSPPVKKVLVEMDENCIRVTSSTPECKQWSSRKAVEASPEICRKSNSTGFSKIWRFKDLLGRSNSDGRDAFVFLNNSHAAPASAEKPAAVKGEEEDGEKKEATVRAKGKVKTGKTSSLSAHEVYLKSKALEEERRRSYLPYRPELMGFFTNVNGGLLSKNVHPF